MSEQQPPPQPPAFRALVTRKGDEDAHRVVEALNPGAIGSEEELRCLLGVPKGAVLDVFDDEFGQFVRFEWKRNCLAAHRRPRFRWTEAVVPPAQAPPAGTATVRLDEDRSAEQDRATLKLAMADVEQWARKHESLSFGVMRAGDNQLFLGRINGDAVVGCSLYVHEEGVRTELTAQFIAPGLADVRTLPVEERANVAMWALQETWPLKRGGWSVSPKTGTLTVMVPVLRRFVTGGGLEPLCSGSLTLGFVSLQAAVAAAVIMLPRVRCGVAAEKEKEKDEGEGETGLTGALHALLRASLARHATDDDDDDDGFEYAFDWPCMVGKNPEGETKRLDRRPEALARFGAGLRHGQRVQSDGKKMTVLGVGLAGKRPSLFLLPDGWGGGGVLRPGRVDHWAGEMVATDEPDVVPVRYR